jgi:aldose sugar dehydrogenase
LYKEVEMRRTKVTTLVAAMALLVGCPSPGEPAQQVEPPATSPDPTAPDARVVAVVEGLEHPWGLAFLPDDEGILITERPGRLRLVRDGVLQLEPIAGVPDVRAQGQGGLLDVALHPNFGDNRLVYLTYSKPGPDGATTALARGRLEGNALIDVHDIFVADAWAGGNQHFGSRIAFDRDGYLYITIGDRGDMERAQNLGDHAGTTIRLQDDGRVPPDNPFVGREDARDEIFTYGNRNAQGMAVHPETGEIWQNEHGPRGGDEVNVVVAGANYGWPRYRFGTHYDGRPIPDPEPGLGIQTPILHWTPALAPSGMTFYAGDAFPQWRGDAFVGGLAGERLERIRFDGSDIVEQEVLLEDRGDRIRAVEAGPDGLIYILVDDADAPLLRLEPADSG